MRMFEYIRRANWPNVNESTLASKNAKIASRKSSKENERFISSLNLRKAAILTFDGSELGGLYFKIRIHCWEIRDGSELKGWAAESAENGGVAWVRRHWNAWMNWDNISFWLPVRLLGISRPDAGKYSSWRKTTKWASGSEIWINNTFFNK